MTSDPAYDYPEPYANPRQGPVASPHRISLTGRLRLTHPVWLQLGINAATALHILQRQPAGTFLVRRSNTRQCQVLCLRLQDDSSPAFVTTYCLRQERAATFLEGSDRSFPGLLHLISFYCSTPDFLPLPLRLPQPIWEASSCQELEAIAHLGLEFWNSSLNTKGLPGRPPSGPTSGTDPAPRFQLPSDLQDQTCPPLDAGAHSFPAPEDSPLGDMGARRQYFKNNVKVQVSTEAVSTLSPPASPPPPIPVGKKKNPPCPPRSPAPDGCGFHGVTFGGYCTPPSKNLHRDPIAPSSSLRQLICVEEEEPPTVSALGCSPWPPRVQESEK